MEKKPKILVLNGPNLDQLGRRDQDLYGKTTIMDITRELMRRGEKFGYDVEAYQRNDISLLTKKLADTSPDGLIWNPGSLQYITGEMKEAIVAYRPKPVIEVHITNLFARENYQTASITAPHVTAVIGGLKGMGYMIALDALMSLLYKES